MTDFELAKLLCLMAGGLVVVVLATATCYEISDRKYKAAYRALMRGLWLAALRQRAARTADERP
jgi:hypothetical protein